MTSAEGNVDVNGISMRYEIVGQGPPLVFIHGWSFSRSCWAAQIREFSTKYRVIAFDWRGMGQTTGGLTEYPFDQLVADVHGLLVALRVERPILCGHSIGGSIVQSYALQHPDEVARAIVVDSNFPSTDGAIRSLRLQAFELEIALGIPLLPRVLHTMDILWAVIVHGSCFYAPTWRQSHPTELAVYKARFMSNNRRSLVNAFQAWAYRPVLRGQLGKITCPLLAVHGSLDRQVPASQMQAMVAEVPGAVFESLEGAGHMAMQQEPEAFNAKVSAFLARTDRVAAS
jgi:3-oxoadipate enol-lactonase